MCQPPTVPSRTVQRGPTGSHQPNQTWSFKQNVLTRRGCSVRCCLSPGFLIFTSSTQHTLYLPLTSAVWVMLTFEMSHHVREWAGRRMEWNINCWCDRCRCVGREFLLHCHRWLFKCVGVMRVSSCRTSKMLTEPFSHAEKCTTTTKDAWQAVRIPGSLTFNPKPSVWRPSFGTVSETTQTNWWPHCKFEHLKGPFVSWV